MPLLQSVQRLAIKKLPEIRSGYTVKIYQKIKEGEKERIQIYEGLVIAVNSGYGADKTITVRKVVDGIGVEKIFPLFSTNIDKIEVMKKAHVRRAKLYYMRERSGKSARLKEVHVTADERKKSMEEDVVAAPEAVEEAVTEETTVEETPTAEATTPVETEEVVESTEVAEEVPTVEEETKVEEEAAPAEEAKAEDAVAEEPTPEEAKEEEPAKEKAE